MTVLHPNLAFLQHKTTFLIKKYLKMKKYFVLFFALIAILSHAQPTLDSLKVTSFTNIRRGKAFRLDITKETKIFDKKTGEEIPYEKYQQLRRSDPMGTFAEPIYDAYGQPSSFYFRETTDKEKAEKRFQMVQKPEKLLAIGDELPSFIMILTKKLQELTK